MTIEINKKFPNEKKESLVFLLDHLICEYVRDEWLDPNKPVLPQAETLGVHRHIIKKILENQPYRIPISTIAIMCFNKNISLSEFIKTIENKYGTVIKDDFISKAKKNL